MADDFLEAHLAWHKTEHPTTHGKAKIEVRLFFARFDHRPIDTLHAMEMKPCKTYRLTKDKVALENVDNQLCRLQAAFRRGVKWKEPDFNPLEEAQAPRGVRSIAARLYDRAVTRKLHRANPDRAPLWLLMAHTGLRRGELVGLGKDSVDGRRLGVESEPDVDGQGRTKSGKWREVPLNTHAAAALATLPDPLVSVHKDTVSDWLKDDATAAGVGGSLHRLRHTFCAHMVMAGVPL